MNFTVPHIGHWISFAHGSHGLEGNCFTSHDYWIVLSRRGVYESMRFLGGLCGVVTLFFIGFKMAMHHGSRQQLPRLV